MTKIVWVGMLINGLNGSSTSGNRRIQINFRSSLPIFLNRIYLPHVIHTAYLHDKPLHFVEVYNAGGTDFQPGYLITSEQEMTLSRPSAS